MLMKDNKKNVAALIVGRLRKPESEDKMEEQRPEPEMGEMDELSMVAEEIMSAVSNKDAEGLKEALKSFVQMCGMDDSEESEDYEESED